MSEAVGTQLTRQGQELGIFHDVAKALTSSLDLDSILQTIMEKMAEYFRPDTWSLLMVDEQKDELYFAIAVGEKAEELKNERLKVGEGIAGWVAKHGEHVISDDAANDPRFAKRIDERTQWETRSVICGAAEIAAARAGCDSVGECGPFAVQRAGDFLFAVAMRLRGDRD